MRKIIIDTNFFLIPEQIGVDIFEEFKKEGYPDFMVDIVHPNSEGHEMISRKVISFLSENFGI